MHGTHARSRVARPYDKHHISSGSARVIMSGGAGAAFACVAWGRATGMKVTVPEGAAGRARAAGAGKEVVAEGSGVKGSGAAMGRAGVVWGLAGAAMGLAEAARGWAWAEMGRAGAAA